MLTTITQLVYASISVAIGVDAPMTFDQHAYMGCIHAQALELPAGAQGISDRSRIERAIRDQERRVRRTCMPLAPPGLSFAGRGPVADATGSPVDVIVN